MKEITLTPYAEFGEVYKQPFFRKWGNGKWPEGYAIKFILVATANFDIFAEPCKWKMTANKNVSYTVKHNINVPLRARDASLTGLPKNAFKAKVEMIEGGKATIEFTTGKHKVKFLMTYEDARDINIKALAVFLQIPEVDLTPITDPIKDDNNYEVEPEIVHPKKEGFFDMINTFLNKNKWYFFGGCLIAGFIIGLIL